MLDKNREQQQKISKWNEQCVCKERLKTDPGATLSAILDEEL
jgi:hypothetical protein